MLATAVVFTGVAELVTITNLIRDLHTSTAYALQHNIYY